MDWFLFVIFSILGFIALSLLGLVFYVFWLVFGWFIVLIAFGAIGLSYLISKE